MMVSPEHTAGRSVFADMERPNNNFYWKSIWTHSRPDSAGPHLLKRCQPQVQIWMAVSISLLTWQGQGTTKKHRELDSVAGSGRQLVQSELLITTLDTGDIRFLLTYSQGTGSVLAAHCCTSVEGHAGNSNTPAVGKRRRSKEVRLQSSYSPRGIPDGTLNG